MADFNFNIPNDPAHKITQEEREQQERDAFDLDTGDRNETDSGGDQNQLVDLEIGGQVFKVPQAQYDAHMAEKAGRDEALAQYETQLSRQQEDQDYQEEQDPNAFLEGFYQDPDGTLTQYKKDILAEVRSEVQRERRDAESKDQFWDSFYRDNKELKNEDTLVKLMLSANWDTLSSRNSADASKELARITKGEILRIANQYGGSKEQNDLPSLTGGDNSDTGSQEQDRQQEDNSNNIPISLSDALNERRKQREKAS